MMDACVYHAVPLGSEPEVGFARLEVRFGGGDVAFNVVLGEQRRATVHRADQRDVYHWFGNVGDGTFGEGLISLFD